jgi:hypothetical protein
MRSRSRGGDDSADTALIARSHYFIRGAKSFAPPASPSFPSTSTISPARFDGESIRRDIPALARLINGKP